MNVRHVLWFRNLGLVAETLGVSIDLHGIILITQLIFEQTCVNTNVFNSKRYHGHIKGFFCLRLYFASDTLCFELL